MTHDDLAAVVAIQAQCYDALKHESLASFAVKLDFAPEACLVATLQDGVVGYLVSVPAMLGSPPPLHAETFEIPACPNCLYLHDLAVSPAARGTGAAGALIRAFLERVQTLGYHRASLTAVQNSEGFWSRHGFQAVASTEALQQMLVSYGPGARYMEWPGPGRVDPA